MSFHTVSPIGNFTLISTDYSVCYNNTYEIYNYEHNCRIENEGV